MLYTVKSVQTLSTDHRHQLLELFAEADFADTADGTQWLAAAVENSLAAVAAFALGLGMVLALLTSFLNEIWSKRLAVVMSFAVTVITI